MSADQVVEIRIPGATSDDVRRWATEVVTHANPVTPGSSKFTPEVNCDITDHPFMGVELTFQSERRQLLTLVLFAEVPNEKEVKVMEADGVTGGGA